MRTVVQLGRIKGIKGRLVTRIFRFPASTPARKKGRDEREREREGKKRMLKTLLLSCAI